MKNNIDKLIEQKNRSGTWGNLSTQKINIIQKFSGSTILDVGCSTGSYVKYLNNHGLDTYGCDLFEHSEWKGEFKDKFKVGNAYKLPYKKEYFDTVIALEVLEHLDNPAKVLKELGRVARKNIIISVPNCLQYDSLTNSGLTYYHNIDRTHVNYFDKFELLKLINKSGFSVEYINLINPVMPETLLLNSWHLPLNISVIIGKIFQRIPLSEKYFTDIIVVASKN